MKKVKYMGLDVIINDDENLLQPEDQMALVSILEKSEMVNFTITPNEDGTFTYSFNYRIPKADVITLKKDGEL